MARARAPSLWRLSVDVLEGIYGFGSGAAGRSSCGCMSMLTQARQSPCPSTLTYANSLQTHLRWYSRRVVRRAYPRGRPLQNPQSTQQVVQTVQVSESWKNAFALPDVILNRQIELGDLLLGFEQQRQMSLQTPSGEILLAIAEEPGGLFSGVLLRQVFESTRAFTINVFALDDPSQPAVLFQIKRSFPWLDPMAWLYREILVTDAQNKVVASVTRVWHPLYRSYDLYEAGKPDDGGDTVMKMFGRISVPFWTAMFTWSYPIQDATGNSPATIERIFGAGVQGAAEQIFTEKGNYHLAFRDSSMGVNQKLSAIACAISIDYDYYSRRVGGGGWMWPAMVVWAE